MTRSRRLAQITLAAGLLYSCTSAPPIDEEAEVLAALTTFLRAFENGDLDAMEASFSDDASTFPRVVMSSETVTPIDTADYRRVTGLDPGMRELIASWQDSPAGPPYMTLAPKDLEIRVFTDAALVSFHLESGARLSRRTFVLGKEEGSWRIVHLHASNVVGSD